MCQSSLHWNAVLLALLMTSTQFGCGRAPEQESGSTATTPTTTGTGPTTSTETTSSTLVVTETPSAGIAWAGWHVEFSNTETFGDAGYTVKSWEIGPEWPNYFETNLGTPRRFYSITPNALEVGEEPDMLVLFHGGVLGNDGPLDYYKKDPWGTYCGQARETAREYISSTNSAIPHLAIERRMAIVIPENLWCDYWIGQGPDDPVDTEHHRSYEHVAEVLDFAQVGGLGFPINNTYAWGVSAGATGAMVTAARHQTVSGVIVDSSPCNKLIYYDHDSGALDHIYGGPPYEEDGVTPSKWYDRYLETSCHSMVSTYGFQVPIYVAYNARDRLTDIENPVSLVEALESTYPAWGGRFGAHDFSHYAPGALYHTQTRLQNEPMPYISEMMFRFLEGTSLIFVEAEEGCVAKSCDVGDVVIAGEGDDLAYLIGGSGLSVSAKEGAGVLYRGELPVEIDTVDEDTDIVVTAVISTDTSGLQSETPIVTIEYTDQNGASYDRTLTATDFASPFNVSTNVSEVIRQVSSTDLSFVKGEAGELTVRVHGDADVVLDAFIYQMLDDD